MHFKSVAAFAALAAVALAAPTTERLVLHQKRAPSENWLKLDRVHSDVKLPMRIGIVQDNLDKGHDMLMDISDPASPNYSNHMTAEEVIDFFAPAQHRVDAVVNWLHKAGVEAHRISHSVNKQWVQLDLSTHEAEALLNTRYHFYEHRNGKTTIGCDQYHVHEDVKDHVDYITPGIRLLSSGKPSKRDLEKRTFGWGNVKPLPPLKAPLPVSVESVAAPGLICNVVITPECIQTMYNFTPATQALAGNELGIFEDLGDYYNQQDLNDFFGLFYPTIPQGTHPKLEGVDGGVAPTANQAAAGPESDLDFQISYPIIYPQNSILFQTDDPDYEANYTYAGFFNNFLEAIDGSYCQQEKNNPNDPPYPHNSPNGYKHPKQCGVYKPTHVVSISYGGQEADLDFNYQKRQCAEFLKLGLQGTSFLISSGDSGVAGPAGDDNPNGCLGPGGKVFSPDFPVTCPYVTAVGATFLPPTANPTGAGDQEVAVQRFGSGGGFSNIYAQPSYQKTAVQGYLKAHGNKYPSYGQGSVGNGVYNRTGRGYPDVSAVGDNVIIFTGGLPTLIGGTSASAPVFASLITRINDARLRAGKKTVGFINPALYAHPNVLHDITSGNNPGCNTTGFDASTGWDPVTGLGTPNYPAMLKLFLSLP